MTRYGSLVAWAKQLGRNDCASLQQQNLQEEKAADKKLTSLAESGGEPSGCIAEKDWEPSWMLSVEIEWISPYVKNY